MEQEREIEQLKFTLDQQSERSMDPQAPQQAQQQQAQQPHKQPEPAAQPAAAADAGTAAVAASFGDGAQVGCGSAHCGLQGGCCACGPGLCRLVDWRWTMRKKPAFAA